MSGPIPGEADTALRTGTSVSAALAAGAAAMLMEWGLLKGNDLQLNSHKMIKYLTLGCLCAQKIWFTQIKHGDMVG